jgi:carbamoyltransferase
MWTLGLSMEHDASAAIARDRELVAAISEERLSRKKGQWGFPWRAIDACLKMAGIGREQVDTFSVALNKIPAHYFRRPTWARETREAFYRAKRDLQGRPQEITLSVNDFVDEVRRHKRLLVDLFREEVFRKEGFKNAKLVFTDHHHTHAVTAWHYSGFDDALILTIDCVGASFVNDYEKLHDLVSLQHAHMMPLSHSISRAQGGRIVRESQSDLSGSPGNFYGIVTQALGFISPRHEGKVTGLAAWGKDTTLDAPFEQVLQASPSRTYFQSVLTNRVSANLSEEKHHFIKSVIKGHTRENVAGAAQRTLEKAVLAHVRDFAKRTGIRRIACAGGVFGNVKLNQHIMELPEIDEVFVFPAMSDAGLAVGAALMPAIVSGAPAKSARLDNVYYGPGFTNHEIKRILDKSKSKYKYRQLLPEERAQHVAKLVADGKIVGLFQGRMEFGPRALGNRTILANPTDPQINNWLNERLDRSEFMPFAPSVLAEACPEIFENFSKGAYTAKFMTITYTVREKWRPRMAAVVHIDGTARPQAVSRQDNPRYYDIIKEYEKITGLPVILNTSFNVHEEPIICKPEEALRALDEGRVDLLVLEDFIVTPEKEA